MKFSSGPTKLIKEGSNFQKFTFIVNMFNLKNFAVLTVGPRRMILVLHRHDQKLNGRANVFLLFFFFEYATVTALQLLSWHLFLLTYEN